MERPATIDFALRHAVGAITTAYDLAELIREARTDRKAIRIWRVQQLGRIEPFYLTSRSELVRDTQFTKGGHADTVQAFDAITGFVDHLRLGFSDTKRRWTRSEIRMGTFNIDGCSSRPTEMRLFTSAMLALRYSQALRSDAEYVTMVAAYHAEFDERMRDFSRVSVAGYASDGWQSVVLGTKSQ